MGGFLFLNKKTMKPPYGKEWYRKATIPWMMRLEDPNKSDSQLVAKALLLLLVASVVGYMST